MQCVVPTSWPACCPSPLDRLQYNASYHEFAIITQSPIIDRGAVYYGVASTEEGAAVTKE